MSHSTDNKQGLRLNHAELVSPDRHNAIVGMAWDAYLEAAARLVPAVLNTLFAHHEASAPRDVREEKTERGQRITEWCRRWGFRQDYAFCPAWNSLGALRRAQRTGTLMPDEFVCRWAGDRYPRWEDKEPGQRLGGSGISVVGDDSDEWNPDGTPHPFPELAGRLLSHYKFQLVGGNGIRPLPQKQAAQMGTQVKLELPLFYWWEPAAETRAEARERIIGTIDRILDTDLETIEQAHRAHGYVSPPEKRTAEHFEWLVRFQMLGESRSQIARTVSEERGRDDPSLYRSHVGREIKSLAELMKLKLRET